MKRSPSEFELIARLCAGIRNGRRTILGPGDDCAILSPARRPILFTIDSMVENVHFRREWASPQQIGARALTVNLSDIAAMGGSPTACVVNLAVPKGLDGRFFDRLYDGLRSTAAAAEVDIVGGNITRGEQLTITIALLGEAGRVALRRDAARPRDHIYVTGTLGDAAAGWRILAGDLRARMAARRFLVARYLAPVARLDAGRRLARLHPPPAAIDISDGLLQDLGHILERSHVGAVIDPDAIPRSAAYREVLGDNLELALSGGEDYELLFCVGPHHDERSLRRRLGIDAHRIGTIVKGRTMIAFSGTQGARPIVKTRGFDQLRVRN